MCGRFDTSHLYWRDIHEQLSRFASVRTEPQNLEPSDDVRPTTVQLTARLEDGQWVLEKMRWSLLPFWRNGKPLKDTAKGADDGFKLTTFNCKVETCHSASTFREAYAKRRCIVPASASQDCGTAALPPTRGRLRALRSSPAHPPDGFPITTAERRSS